MIRKLFAALGAIVLTASIAVGANISYQSGPLDTWQAAINNLIQSINGGVSGVIFNAMTTASTTATTVETTLQTFTLPANFLSTAGQELDIECYGGTGTDTNNKTIQIYFGSTSFTSGTTAASNRSWNAKMKVSRSAAAVQNIYGTMTVTGGPSTAYTTYGATENLAAAVTIKCTGTNGSSVAGDISVGGMRVLINR